MGSPLNSKNKYLSALTPEELAVLKQCADEGNQKARPTAIITSAALMLGVKMGYIKSKSTVHSAILAVTAGVTTYFFSRVIFGAKCISNLPPDFVMKFEERMKQVDQQSYQGTQISPSTPEDTMPTFPQRHDGISLDVRTSDYTFSTPTPDESQKQQSQPQSQRQYTNTYESLREQNRRLYEENAKKTDSYKPLASDTFWESSRRPLNDDYKPRADDFGSFQQHYKD